MKSKLIVVLGIASFSWQALAGVQSFYCPQNHGYINIGMTPDQVLSACGQPLSKQQSNQPVMEQVPVTQLIFNNQGAPTASYGVWSMPVGINSGAKLEVDIIDNKVSAFRLNGSNTNAISICGGAGIKVGDPATRVYGACGSPTLVNHSYINRPILSNQKPEIWLYQPGQYQSPISLTFVNGKLQSID